MNNIIKAVFALTVCGFLAACQNSVNTIENTDKSATPNDIRDSRFVTDGWLSERLALRYVRTAVAPSGFLTVEVAATNVRTGVWSGNSPYSVDYKFVWQDANGMTVDTPLSIWKTVKVKPGETVYFKTVAPTRQCKDFILNLKEHK